MKLRTPFFLAAAALIGATQCVAAPEPVVYRGMCDASAAVALGPDEFVVADDEFNQLKFYRRGQPEPITGDASGDLWTFLDTARDKESDLEGAAVVGRRIYWIASHGRNKNAKVRPERYRFFATDIQTGAPRLAPAGHAYTGLLQDMIEAEQLKMYHFDAAAQRAPEASGGFNIEGLAATPEGTLLIGLRNPLAHNKALVVPLLNPAELLDGRKARFGTAVELDLGKRGIRSIERIGDAYLIVAGPPANRGDFALYRWSGHVDDNPVRLTHINFGTLHPEAMFAVPDSDKVQILSDDGTDECKALEKAQQSFRSVIVKP